MSAAWSERVGRVGGYPPLSGLSDLQRREFHEALLDADTFEDFAGKVAGGDPEGGTQPAAACASSGAD